VCVPWVVVRGSTRKVAIAGHVVIAPSLSGCASRWLNQAFAGTKWNEPDDAVVVSAGEVVVSVSEVVV
jgi:hypothetical protein